MCAERYYNSRKSNLNKTGEPADHFHARLRIAGILEEFGYNVLCLREEQQTYNTKLTIKFPFTGFKYQKAYDIFAQKHFHDTGLTATIIIEIDGSVHDSHVQQKKDRYSEAIAHIVFDNMEFRRLEKSYIHNATDDQIIHALKLGNFLPAGDRVKKTKIDLPSSINTFDSILEEL